MYGYSYETGFVVQGHKCNLKTIAKWKSICHAEHYNAVILNSLVALKMFDFRFLSFNLFTQNSADC